MGWTKKFCRGWCLWVWLRHQRFPLPSLESYRGQPFRRILPPVFSVGAAFSPSRLFLQAAGVPSPSTTPTVVDPGAPSTSTPCPGLVEDRVRG